MQGTLFTGLHSRASFVEETIELKFSVKHLSGNYLHDVYEADVESPSGEVHVVENGQYINGPLGEAEEEIGLSSDLSKEDAIRIARNAVINGWIEKRGLPEDIFLDFSVAAAISSDYQSGSLGRVWIVTFLPDDEILCMYFYPYIVVMDSE